MPITDAPGKARALYDARRDRVQIPPFTDEDPTLGMSDGYAVQRELVDLILADGDTIVGYKVGLTSKPMQQMIGVDSPDYGPILASTVYADGDTVSMATLIQPKMEAEIIAVMGERLQGPGVLVTDAARAVAGVSRVGRDRRLPLPGLADQAGRHRRRPRLQRRVRGLLPGGAAHRGGHPAGGDDADRNGELIGSGAGAAALGDPLAVVAWLANTLGDVGIALEPGHLVMTGALHAAVPMAAGDVFRADFDRLGPVTIRVVA